MQTVQPLAALQAPAPKAEGKAQAGGAEKPSFRASMERAGQEAEGQAAQGAQKAEASQEAQGGQAAEDQAPGATEGLEAAQAQPQEGAQQTTGPGLGMGALESLLPLTPGDGKKQPGEDVPAENEAQGALLAALLTQRSGDTAEPPTELGQGTPIQQPAQEGALPTQTTPWQGAVPQEGERQVASRMEAPVAQAIQPENENTLTAAAPAPVATMAQAAQRQPRERNMAPTPEAPAQQAAQAPAQGVPQQQPPTGVVDLTAPEGGMLPAPEARAALQNSLFEQVQSAVSTGKQELFVQLRPESLGGLVIHLSMTEEGIKAQVRTGSENIQHLVTSQIAQLEDALRARDIPVVQMDVIYDQTAGGGFLSQQRQAWQEGGGRGRGPVLAAPIEETAGLYEAAYNPAPEVAGVDEGVVYSA